MRQTFPTAILLLALFSLATLSGCATRQPLSMQDKFIEAAPRAILVVPAVNKSVDVTAADYMLSTITVPLAERGYYVFPVNAVKRVLEDEGLSDSSLVHDAATARLAAMFGADAVLYLTINRWDAQYMLLKTKVTVGINYQIRSGTTGEVLWENAAEMIYIPQSNGSGLAGLVADVITAAITKGAPDYMPLAHQANAGALNHYPGAGIPFGPYAPDQEALAR